MSGKAKVLGGDFMPPPSKCRHSGEPVTVGEYTIYAGSGLILQPEDMGDYDLRVFLRDEAYAANGTHFGAHERGCLWLPIKDYQAVPRTQWKAWVHSLTKVIIPALREDQLVIAFCAGGHGRTGLLLGSLIAILEPDCDDPVAEVRNRYCKKAVETEEQVAQIHRLQSRG